MSIFKLFCLNLLILLISIHSIVSFMWAADQDSVIIEAIQLKDFLKLRGGRISGSSSLIGRARSVDETSSHLTCYTTIGEVGKCSTLRSCYPGLYLDSNEASEATHDELQSADLANTLKSISGPCDFTKFRIDSDMPDSLICCPNRSSSPTKLKQKQPGAQSTKKDGVKTVFKPILQIPDAVASLVYKPTPNCGYLNNSLVGTEEHENDRRFPWIVALIGKQGHFCSGTLVDKYHVVTAAQCVNFLSPEDVASLRIYLGDYKLNTISDGPLISRRVSRIIYHRHFSEQTLKNDVALLKLNLPAPIGTPKVLPICLPEDTKADQFQDDFTETKEPILLAGWGRNWIHSPTPILRKSTMKVWSNDECRKKYGYLARSGGILDSMLCASSMPLPSHDHDQSRREPPVVAPATAFNEQIQDCIGDSGSPLMRLRKDSNTYELIGITSWNIGCGNYPYVYSRVGKFITWIEKNRRRF